jgi:DNA repair exonuclease SbcCD ATPase subunit
MPVSEASIYRGIVEKWKTEKGLLEKRLDQEKKKAKILQDRVEDLTEARMIIMQVAKDTQVEVAAYIESMVTIALQSVFQNRDYRFLVKQVQRKNRTEIELMVQDGEKEPYYPEDEQGGGLIDIVSFALRVVLWSLQPKRSRNVLILDEPFRFTGGYVEVAGRMMKEVSQKLGLQIIMVTHSTELANLADRYWVVERTGDRSTTRSSAEGEGTPVQKRLKRRNRSEESSGKMDSITD